VGDTCLRISASPLTLPAAWNWGPILFDTTNARLFGEYVGRRYPFTPKLLGGDINTDWVYNGTELRRRGRARVPGVLPAPDEVIPTLLDMPRIECTAIIDAMASGIVSAETPAWRDAGAGAGAGAAGKPMLTYHPSAFWMPWGKRATASHMFPKADWLAFDGCQSGHCDGRKHHFTEPVGKWEAKASWAPLREMWEAEVKRPILDLESHCEWRIHF
jgi:hypothetical protein